MGLQHTWQSSMYCCSASDESIKTSIVSPQYGHPIDCSVNWFNCYHLPSVSKIIFLQKSEVCSEAGHPTLLACPNIEALATYKEALLQAPIKCFNQPTFDTEMGGLVSTQNSHIYWL